MPGMRQSNSARKWEIGSSTGRKNVIAKKEFTMFFEWLLVQHFLCEEL